MWIPFIDMDKVLHPTNTSVLEFLIKRKIQDGGRGSNVEKSTKSTWEKSLDFFQNYFSGANFKITFLGSTITKKHNIETS